MSELKKKAINGLRWTTLSALITGGGSLLQTLILTRLLERSDFGIMAIINILLGLALQLVDMGFSNALLREQSPSRGQLDSMYWLNISLGIFISLLVCLIAAPLAHWQEEPKLIQLLYISSPMFILGAISMLYQTLLQKALMFKHLAIIEVLSFLSGFVLAITLAVNGYGVFALVIGVFAKTAISTMLYWMSARKYHHPSLYFNWADIRPFWKFGYYQTIEKFLNYANINFENLIIGKYLGKEILGIYDVVKRLLLQPIYVLNPIVSKVSYPVMVQVQNDIPRLRNITLRALQLAAVMNAPIYIASFIGATYIVPTLLGEKWSAGIEPFRWLAFCLFIRAIINPFGGVLIAKGKIQYGIYLQIAIFVGICSAVGFGLQFGLTTMLIILAGFYVIYLLSFFYFVIKPLIKVTFNEFFSHLFVELIAASVAFAGSLTISKFLPLGWLQLGIYAILGGIIYILILIKFRPKLIADFKQTVLKTA